MAIESKWILVQVYTWKGSVNNLLKADLHVHTCYSLDCLTSPEKIISYCLQAGINCLAIADHGTIEGALLLKKLAPFTIIIAEEIRTPSGEIMGLFLTKEIPSHSSVNETIQQIQEQNGLVCIPHPGHLFRSSAFKINHLIDIRDKIDIIEVYNGHSYLTSSNNRAKQIASQLNKVPSAGSDAHTLKEIGSVYIEMSEFSTKEEFLVSLSHGKITGHLVNPFVHVFNTKNKIIKQLFN